MTALPVQTVHGRDWPPEISVPMSYLPLSLEEMKALHATGKEDLPLHLIVKILHSLPLLKLHALRLVCRSWNTALKCPVFWRDWCSHQAQAFQSSTASSSWLVMVRWSESRLTKEFLAFSCAPSASGHPGRWISLQDMFGCHRLTSSDLSEHLGGAGWPWLATPQVSSGSCCLHTSLMAASGSLMCFLLHHKPLSHETRMGSPMVAFGDAGAKWEKQEANRDEGVSVRGEGGAHDSSYSLVVINIITGKTEYVPLPPGFCGESWDMVLKLTIVDRVTGSYRILILSSFYSSLDVYDSTSKAWRKGQPIRTAQPADVATVCKAHFFHTDTTGAHVQVFAYNLERDAWSCLRVALPETAQKLHFLATKYQERLFLACALKPPIRPKEDFSEQKDIALYNGFGVWEIYSEPLSPMVSTPRDHLTKSPLRATPLSSLSPQPSSPPLPPPQVPSRASPSAPPASSRLSSWTSSLSPLSASSLPTTAASSSPLPMSSPSPMACVNGGSSTILKQISLVSSHLLSSSSAPHSTLHYSQSIKFMASENIICMTGVLQSKEEEKYITPLAYDIASDCWYDIPSHEGRTDLVGVCAFDPRFMTLY